MGLREQKKQQTRQSILDTANRLFREKGYEHTRVVDIIEPVQISKKTFFNYFPSKEAVLLCLAEDWFQRHTTNQGVNTLAASSEQTLSPIEKLHATILLRLDAIIGDKAFVRTLVNHSKLLNPQADINTPPLSSINTNYNEILDLIREAQIHKEIRDDIPAEELHGIFIASRNATLTRWLMSETEIDLKQQMSNVLKVILKGFQTD